MRSSVDLVIFPRTSLDLGQFIDLAPRQVPSTVHSSLTIYHIEKEHISQRRIYHHTLAPAFLTPRRHGIHTRSRSCIYAGASDPDLRHPAAYSISFPSDCDYDALDDAFPFTRGVISGPENSVFSVVGIVGTEVSCSSSGPVASTIGIVSTDSRPAEPSDLVAVPAVQGEAHTVLRFNQCLPTCLSRSA